jgi:hypothetical protein
VYARAVLRRRRAVAVQIGAVAALSAALAGCHPASPQDRKIDLCGDLLHLGDTIDFLVHPPAEARVGQVRGSLDKLDPTFEAIEDATDLVPQNVAEDVQDAQDAYRDAIEEIGDDHFLADAEVPVADAQRSLEDAVQVVEFGLGCESLSRSPPLRLGSV